MQRKKRICLTLFLVLFLTGSVAAGSFATEAPMPRVVINEIAWSGASWDHTAEWIELYNTTDAPIDLDGWKLISSDGAQLVALRGVISSRADDPSGGYFLLERGSDDSVPTVGADLIYQGALSDTGESLALVDAEGEIIDTANRHSDDDTSLAWPAGTSFNATPSCASMERVQFKDPDEPSNWATTLVVAGNPEDQDVLGTPRAENSTYNAPPAPHITITPIVPQPGITATFSAEGSTDPNDPIASYHWIFADGEEADGLTATHTFAEAGQYSVTLVVTDSKGTESKLVQTVQVAVTVPPIVDFSLLMEAEDLVARSGDPITFQDESADFDSEIVAWEWRFGDGATATGPVVVHTYSTDGEYVVSLRVEDANGEVATQTESLRVASRLPTVAFKVDPPSPNEGQVVTFDASDSFDSDGEITSYEWDFDGDGTIDDTTQEPTIQHMYETGGSYTPQLCVVDDKDQRATREISLIVNVPPVARFTVSNFEPNETEAVAFSDLSLDSDGQIVQWVWDFVDGSTSDLASPTHTYSQSGLRNVTLTVTDDHGAFHSAVATLTVINLPPTASLTVDDDTEPTGSAFTFDASASSDPSPKGHVVEYEWSIDSETDFDAETTGPTWSYAFLDNGQYDIRVRVTDSDGGTAVSDPVTVTVTNRPPVVSGATWTPSNPVDGEEVSFVLSSSDVDGTIAGWVWTLELESESVATGTTATFSHVFQDDGLYALSVRVRDDDGTTSAPYSLTIDVGNAPPVAAFGAKQGSACGVASVQFDATPSDDPSPSGRIVYFGWNFGDGTSCPGATSGCDGAVSLKPVHCYSAPGTYIVTLVVIDEQGALSRVHKTIRISE